MGNRSTVTFRFFHALVFLEKNLTKSLYNEQMENILNYLTR